MRKSPLALAALAVFALAGTASAADLTDQSTVTFNVESMCAFEVMEDSIDGEADISSDAEFGVITSSSSTQTGNLSVACSTGVPYTIQVDAEAGGAIPLTGATTAGTVPAYIYQGLDTSAPVLGTVANGENYAGTGNGEFQQVSYTVAINQDETGMPLAIPAVDNYSRVLNWILSY